MHQNWFCDLKATNSSVKEDARLWKATVRLIENAMSLRHWLSNKKKTSLYGELVYLLLKKIFHLVSQLKISSEVSKTLS